MRKVPFFVTILAFLVLAGCSQSTVLTFYQDESWEIQSEFSYDPEEIPEIGLSGSIFDWLSVDASTSMLNPTLVNIVFDQVVAHYRQQGLIAGWEKTEKRHEINYLLTVTGQGWERLESVMALPEIEGMAIPASYIEVRELDENQIQVRLGQQPVDSFDIGSLIPTAIKLRGRRIVSSNALEVKGGVATWQHASNIEAVLVPVSKGHSWLIGGIVAGLVILVGGTVAILNMSYSKRHPTYRYQKGGAPKPPPRPTPPLRRR